MHYGSYQTQNLKMKIEKIRAFFGKFPRGIFLGDSDHFLSIGA